MPGLGAWLALALGAVVASTIGGVVGFGAGIIMLPLIAWTLGARASVPVLTVAMLFGNAGRVWFSREEVQPRVVAYFLIGAVPATIAGATLYTHLEVEWISRILGTFMLLSVPLRRWLSRRGVWVRLRHFPLIGAGFGFLSALVSSVGPVMSPFFLGYGLRRGAYIGTDALCTVGMYVVRIIVFGRFALLTPPTLTAGILIGVVMVSGAWMGRHLLDRISERVFLLLIEAILVVCGLQFLLLPVR